jgi:hypothetical protein
VQFAITFVQKLSQVTPPPVPVEVPVPVVAVPVPVDDFELEDVVEPVPVAVVPVPPAPPVLELSPQPTDIAPAVRTAAQANMPSFVFIRSCLLKEAPVGP